MFGQPARAQAECAVWMTFLAHDQLQHAVAGNRGDRVFAHAQGRQRVHQRLGMQAHQMGAVVRQLAGGQGLVEGVGQAVDQHAFAAGQAQALEELRNGPGAVARQDFHQVAGRPALP